MSLTTLHLYKQNFKFSAAHFLIFDQQYAEKLHGHNYQVKVYLQFSTAPSSEKGYLVDFAQIKKFVKETIDQWDEVILLPENQREMRLKVEGASLRVEFRERIYVFPKNEVVLLPVTNTSVEQLSDLLAQKMKSKMQKYGVKAFRVFVEETRGQGASTSLEL